MNERKRTRRTPQKMAIDAYLAGNREHPCAEEIHEALRPRFPTMSLSTVYNELHRLQREGRVHEVAIGSGKARFDPDSRPHHHLVCVECRAVVDIERSFDLALGPGDARGFRVLHHHVGFYGLCPDCQAKANTAKSTKEMS
ncbi:MAG TPA: transcriptional repressor [Candidatus Aminicenantes bacterium]|nr:transcriptional repressor [Candidatus Aminicenantes bacterium]